ncbi:OsmC family protein [Natronorubrum sulfidifaciens]|uniref:OsmC family protein n=1 Tax=Natronorubrum sulfidifaciens JCM 14089 TaxID=1230460 RepID=L9W8M6_9EURY|nr:OsmC family protein [Natronorubrum sulfidifaciens]ELY44678.1 OsmC family protein [Natronorubrum sulfidifaciens JCM 14089]
MTTDDLHHTAAQRTGEIEHGLDAGGHLEFIEWLEANPDDGMLEFRASGVTEDVANRTTATIGEWALGGEEMGEEREHVLEFGLPTELEDAMAYLEPTERYEAIEGALAGLTACINGTIVYNAIREGIEIDDVTTTVRAPVDLRMLFGVHDADRAHEMYGELEIDIAVAGDLTPDEQSAVREYPKRSPVYNLVTLEHPNRPNVEITSAA